MSVSDGLEDVPALLPSDQVAALLHIGERALRDYDRRGWLSPLRIGRRKLYRADEVVQLLVNGTLSNTRRTKG
jgi:DNA-binding transcriptional MerR regulator